MLQIRLSKGPPSEGSGGLAKTAPPLETVTVACPEHLVIANLPVAKSVGVFTFASTSPSRNIGRRSRRQLGDRIHFCVRCDFPIAIYGRLIPCEHAFCLACSRSDPSCYLCDERVQKIQTIKMLEGIFICAAPHCLKSFLKKAEFESHVQTAHADLLLQPNPEKDGGSETNNLNVARPPSSADLQKLLSLPESSTARAPPPRSAFSPSSNSQPPDREERLPHRVPSRDQPYLRPPPQLRALPFPSSQPAEGSDRLYSWFPPPQQDSSDQFPLDKSVGAPPHPESMFPLHQPNFQVFPNPNQPLLTAPFNFFGAPFDMPRPDSASLLEGGAEQGSVLGMPPLIPAAGFREKFPRPWGMDLMGMPFQPVVPVGQGISDGFANSSVESQVGTGFFQGDFGQAFPPNSLLAKESEPQQNGGSLPGGKIQGSLPLPPPPPLPLSSLKLNMVRFPNDKGRFGNWTD